MSAVAVSPTPRQRALRVASRALAPVRSHTFVFAVMLTLALIVTNLIVDPSFSQWGAVPSTLGTLAPLALVSMASTPSIISGGIDLSLGPLLSLCNVMMVAVLLPHGLGSPWVSIPIIVALGAAVGAANGVLVTVLRFPPVIATLASLFVLLGVAYDLAPTPHEAAANWTSSLTGMVGPIPGALIIMVVPVLLWVGLRLTALRNTLYFVGDDDVAAFTAGANVAGVRILAYALGGLIAALAGLALTGIVHSGDSSLGLQYTLIALAAVVLGGTPLGGGAGGMIGAFFGAASIYLIQNLIDAVNVNPTWLLVVYGGVLITAAVLGGLLSRAAQAAGRAT
jgi:ribose transport system permease protein